MMDACELMAKIDSITSRRPASKRIDVRGQDECWKWTGGTNGDGYAKVRVNGKKELVHRLIFSLFTGQDVSGKVVRHKCDNPICQNPNHLLLGTICDNVMDRNSRNRQAKGERIANSKLTEEQVKEIRKRHVHRVVTYRELSEEFGVSLRQIWMIVSKRNWRHC